MKNITSIARALPLLICILFVSLGATTGYVLNGGALGTPTSGTLTNCTGLPVSGTLLTAGTGLTISTNTISLSSPIANLSITNGNQTTTSDVAGNISDLVYAVSANSVYTINGSFHIGCNNTGGVKLAITTPASTTQWLNVWGPTTANTAFITQNITASGTLIGTAVNQENAQRTVYISGTITTAATSGNLQFQFASGTNTQTSTIYQEGSFLRIQKIQ